MWEHLEYDEVSAGAGSFTSCIFSLGDIDCAAPALPLKLENIVTSHVDWMAWQAFALSESSHRYLAVHVFNGAIYAATNTPLTPYRPNEINADSASCCRSHVLNLGSYSLLSHRAPRGVVKPDVGVERAKDALQLIGEIAPHT